MPENKGYKWYKKYIENMYLYLQGVQPVSIHSASELTELAGFLSDLSRLDDVSLSCTGKREFFKSNGFIYDDVSVVTEESLKNIEIDGVSVLDAVPGLRDLYEKYGDAGVPISSGVAHIADGDMNKFEEEVSSVAGVLSSVSEEEVVDTGVQVSNDTNQNNSELIDNDICWDNNGWDNSGWDNSGWDNNSWGTSEDETKDACNESTIDSSSELGSDLQSDNDICWDNNNGDWVESEVENSSNFDNSLSEPVRGDLFASPDLDELFNSTDNAIINLDSDNVSEEENNDLDWDGEEDLEVDALADENTESAKEPENNGFDWDGEEDLEVDDLADENTESVKEPENGGSANNEVSEEENNGLDWGNGELEINDEGEPEEVGNNITGHVSENELPENDGLDWNENSNLAIDNNSTSNASSDSNSLSTLGANATNVVEFDDIVNKSSKSGYNSCGQDSTDALALKLVQTSDRLVQFGKRAHKGALSMFKGIISVEKDEDNKS